MSENVIQTSFSSGELAPSLYARVDLAKYHSGAARMRNWFVDYRSGASTRPGTEFIIQCRNGIATVRLIPFQFSSTTSYVIEFGDTYCRFISNGASVLEAPFAITGIVFSNPVGITALGNNFNSGDWVFVTGLGGAVQLNNRFYQVINIGGTVTLADVNGVPVNASAYSPYTGGGTISRVYQIPSPYTAAELALLKFTQNASAMTLTHPNHPPYNLTLVGPTNWSFTAVVIGSSISAPTGLILTTSAAGAASYTYAVTAVDSNGQESLASIAQITNAINFNTTPGTITFTWNAVPGAQTYNVYKSEMSLVGAMPGGIGLGFIQSVTSNALVDSFILPDFSNQPPLPQNPILGNNPGAVAYFQQRLVYAASDAFPMTFWMSQPGSYNNFNISNPIQDDDAITGTLVSLQVNAIKSMIAMPGGLIMLTAKGAWQVSGGGGGIAANTPITPADATAIPQAYNGANDVPPIVTNQDILYVQAKGSAVRDLSYNIYANIYTGQDISVMSNHLFFGYTIKEWTYAEEPYKTVWAIRSDGTALCLTYMKEQELAGWSRHDTQGQFESVASVVESSEDATYFVVKRLINGAWTQYIERLAERVFVYGAEDAWSVDAGIQSALPTPNATLYPSQASGSAVIYTTDAAVFANTDVGKIIRAGGGIGQITAVNSAQSVVVNISQAISQTIPNDPDNTPEPVVSGQWSMTAQFTTFYGLDYLEGMQVSILADGGVVTPQVVSGGSITLPNAASKVTVGLGFQAQLQNMKLDTGEPTIQGKRKKINAVTIRAVNTRGLKVGRTFSTVVPIKELTPNIPLGQPIPLTTGDARIVLDPLWDIDGQVCIQQDDPLPATVLGIIPEITVGDTVR